jgi:hypothetical protein
MVETTSFFFNNKAIPLNDVKKLTGCLISFRMDNGKGDTGIFNATENKECTE